VEALVLPLDFLVTGDGLGIMTETPLSSPLAKAG